MTIKLKKPDTITASYRIVTPMFIGNAQQQATDISPASVKGALRFWWRALQWGRIRGKCCLDDALKQLHEEEAILFGSTSYENKKENERPAIGQSRVTFRVVTTHCKNEELDPKEGQKYLLGQGLYNFKEGVLMKPIVKGEMTILCHLDISITPKQKESLEKSLFFLGMLGGLGSRSRKGFGSLSIIEIESDHFIVPKNIEEYKQILGGLKETIGEPPFTAFSKLTKIDISLVGNTPLDLLNSAGNEQQLYRSWGRKQGDVHKVGYKDAEQNFPQSHDLMFDVSQGITALDIPNKAVFGLPQNYFFSSSKINVEFSTKEKNRSRRASPIFIHIHQFLDGKCVLVHSLLPAKFLEEGTVLEFKVGRKKQEINYRHSMTDWKIIDAYMARFDKREIVL